MSSKSRLIRELYGAPRAAEMAGLTATQKWRYKSDYWKAKRSEAITLVIKKRRLEEQRKLRESKGD